MKLTSVIAVWEELHVKDVGELAYCDLQDAIEKVDGIENDINSSQPWSVRGAVMKAAVIAESESEEAK